MSSTEPIDEKKNDGGETTTVNIKGFVFNYIHSLIFTISLGIFVLGATGLYTSKVAQANCLPDSSDMAPFTNIDRVVEEIPIDINIMRQYFWSDPKDTLAQKALFDSKSFLQSYKHGLVCKLKNYGEPNSSMFANGPLYWSTVYNNMSAYNNWAINTAFFYFSYLPESIIMLVYSIFAVFLWAVLYFFNICLSIIFHITAIPQLVRNANSENANEWQAQADISFFTWKTLFLFFWLIPAILSFILLPIISTISGIISPLSATYRYEGGTDKQNILNFIIDTFVYKKLMFMILATLSLISNGISNLGSSSIFSIIVSVIILYFMGFYSNSLPNAGENGFVSGLRKPFTRLKADFVYTTNAEGKQVPKENIVCPPTNVIPSASKLTSSNKTHTVTNAFNELRAKEGATTSPIILEPTAPSVVAQPNINTMPITAIANTPTPNKPTTITATPRPISVSAVAPPPITAKQIGVTAAEPSALPPNPSNTQQNNPLENDMNVYDWSAPAPKGEQVQKGGLTSKKPRVKKYNVKIM